MPQGGAAPPAAGPPGGTGAATASSPMAGVAHQGIAGVKAALELLQKSVAQLPLGTPLHHKVLKFIADVSKDMGEQAQGADDVKQQVAQMARQGPNPNAAAAMSKLFPPQAGADGGGAAPPMAA